MSLEYINSIIDTAMKCCFWLFMFLKWSDIRTIFCEAGGTSLSSKRVIAIACTYTLCKLCILVTHQDRPVDPNILLTLSGMTILSAAIASWSQIMSGVDKLKSFIPTNVAKEVKQSVIKNTTEETQETKIETTTNTQQKEP